MDEIHQTQRGTMYFNETELHDIGHSTRLIRHRFYLPRHSQFETQTAMTTDENPMKTLAHNSQCQKWHETFEKLYFITTYIT